MSQSLAIRRTLPPVQVVFEPGYLSQPVVHQVYVRLLPPAGPAPTPPTPPVPPPPAVAARSAAEEVPHVP